MRRDGHHGPLLLLTCLSVDTTNSAPRTNPTISSRTSAELQPAHGKTMSEGYTIDGPGDEAAGIVVREDGERGFRFHSASKAYHALDGHVFATPAAAQRAARDFARQRSQRPNRNAGEAP
jgi:hypothetical protein